MIGNNLKKHESSHVMTLPSRLLQFCHSKNWKTINSWAIINTMNEKILKSAKNSANWYTKHSIIIKITYYYYKIIHLSLQYHIRAYPAYSSLIIFRADKNNQSKTYPSIDFKMFIINNSLLPIQCRTYTYQVIYYISRFTEITDLHIIAFQV